MHNNILLAAEGHTKWIKILVVTPRFKVVAQDKQSQSSAGKISTNTESVPSLFME